MGVRETEIEVLKRRSINRQRKERGGGGGEEGEEGGSVFSIGSEKDYNEEDDHILYYIILYIYTMDAQLRVRSQMEELRHCLKDLNEWSQDMNTVSPTAEENELGGTGTSTVPIRGKVDLQFTEKQKEERKKSNSTSHGSATDSKAKHTYDNYRDKWDNFDVERALAEVDDQKVANNISTEKGELKEIEHNDSEHVPMLHPSLAQSGVTADNLATNMKISRRPEPKRMDGNEVSVSLRSEGNNAYSKGDYQRALDLYQAAADAASSSSSINDEINENLKSAYSNMAMAYLKVHDWQKAESTSTRYAKMELPFCCSD